MKNKFKKIILLTSVFALTNIVYAESVEPVTVQMDELNKQEMISRIMDLSGLDVQIPQIADMLNSELVTAMSSLPENVAAEMSDLIAISFDGDSMLATVKDEVSKSVSENELEDMLKWYSTDLGIQITKIEEQQQDAEELKLMQEQKKELFDNHLRVSLFEELDKASHITESSIDLQISMMKAMFKMMGKDEQSQEAKEYIKKNKKMMEETTQKSTLLSFLYTYRDLDDDEVDLYIDFLNKGTTQSFIKAVNRGTNKAILDGTNQFIKGILKLKSKYGKGKTKNKKQKDQPKREVNVTNGEM